MSTQALNLQASRTQVTQGQGTYFSVAAGEWKNRVFHLLTTGQGVGKDAWALGFIVGFYCGSIGTRKIKKYHWVILNTKILIPVVMGAHLVVLACGVHFSVVALMASIVIGVVAGSKLEKHYFKDDVSSDAVESLKADRVEHEHSLDLTYEKLTDRKLQGMANAGKFENVTRLILCHNPGVTAKGLLEIIKRCPKLVWLDIGFNYQFTGPNLKEWITCEECSKIKVLELRDTNVTQADLENMIEQSWVQKLEGINVEWNEWLYFPPKNILKLTNLQANPCEQKEPHFGPKLPFSGRGIWVDNWFSRDQVQETPEVRNLLHARKVHLNIRLH